MNDKKNKSNSEKWQQAIKEQLSDVDDLIENEDGVYIAQYFALTPEMKFPCPSLSSALACAKKCLQEGIAVQILSSSQYRNIMNESA